MNASCYSIFAFPLRIVSKNNSAESSTVLSHKFQLLCFFKIIRYPFKFLVAEKPKATVASWCKWTEMKKDSPASEKSRCKLGKRWTHCLTKPAAIIIRKIFNLEQHKKNPMTLKFLTGNSSSFRLKISLQKKNCNKSAVVAYSTKYCEILS